MKQPKDKNPSFVKQVEEILENSPASQSLHKLTDDIEKKYKKAVRWTSVEYAGAVLGFSGFGFIFYQQEIIKDPQWFNKPLGWISIIFMLIGGIVASWKYILYEEVRDAQMMKYFFGSVWSFYFIVFIIIVLPILLLSLML